jgi:hypothetical protein
MTILSSEITFWRPQEVSDEATNGGRISFNQIISATAQNVFGHAFSTERLAGSTKYRKVCVRINNDNDETLYAALCRMFMPTAGGDAISFAMGTARDTQADADDYIYRYGPGTVNTALTAGGSTIIVDCETAAQASAFGQVGDAVFVTDKATWDASAGNIEQHTVAIRSVSGTELTVTIVAPLANSYAAWNSETRTGGHVAFAPATADIGPAISNTGSSFAGTGALDFDQIMVDSLGSAELTITGTFTDATNYTLTADDATHSLGSGTTGADKSPINPANSKPYLTIPALAFSGAPQAGDTFTFQIHPPCLYPWERRVIPESCGSLSGNKIVLVVQGESA